MVNKLKVLKIFLGGDSTDVSGRIFMNDKIDQETQLSIPVYDLTMIKAQSHE